MRLWLYPFYQWNDRPNVWLSKLINKWTIRWQLDWLNKWLNEWLKEWMNYCLISCIGCENESYSNFIIIIQGAIIQWWTIHTRWIFKLLKQFSKLLLILGLPKFWWTMEKNNCFNEWVFNIFICSELIYLLE